MRLILKQPNPTARPLAFGLMPSRSGGRQVLVSFGVTPEGRMVAQATDRGLLRDAGDPFFYLHIAGSTLAMNQSDMQECIDEMRYTRQKKARERPRDIATAQQLKNKVGDLIEAVKDARVGRRRF